MRRFKAEKLFARPTEANSQKNRLKARREGFCKMLTISLLCLLNEKLLDLG